ncbi:MAG: TAT-variant-translocated molybdopterin oxidoreductase [Cytophagales bacterium]|nr:TAT-variant-translocated molybdopterin oxidoreductase [Cytophagales bacterium]
MHDKKIYWKGIEQLTNDPEYVKYSDKEFPDYLPINKNKADHPEASHTSRRDFLKMMGFSIAAVSLASCEAPVRKAIPYLNKPIDIDPGVPNYYASTYMNGGDYCSIVVKTREGRPIKIEGNKQCPITQGGVNAQVEASVLSLYDNTCLKAPQKNGKTIDWEKLDKEITQKLAAIAAQGKQIRIVSNTVLSPTTQATIAIFQQKYPTTKHIVYDPQSCAGIIEANKDTWGRAIIPSYDFSKAEVIVSFSADFLGTWISPIEFTKQYSQTRKLGKAKKTMSRHYQFEANLSLTGANADYRIPLTPSRERTTILALYNLITAKAGAPPLLAAPIDRVEKLVQVANDLWNSRGKSLVVASTNEPSIQILVNAINHLLGNYGTTILLDRPVNYRQGNDQEMSTFISELKAGQIDAVLFFNANPVYNHPEGETIAQVLSTVQLTIATNDRLDETASLVDYVAPDHHYLASWNDALPKAGLYSLVQPTITPIFDTRQAPESFLSWADHPIKDYYTFLQSQWKDKLFPTQSRINDFQQFWDQCLFNGIYETPVTTTPYTFRAHLDRAAKAVHANDKVNSSSLELVLYEKVAIGNGTQANNPWLQEMPDPLSKACWDNYLTLPQSLARAYGIEMKEGKTKMVHLKVGGQTLRIPVLVQPGQAKGTIGLALGYGREKAGRVANRVGVNAYPLVTKKNNHVSYAITHDVRIEPLEETYRIAQTQTHETYMGRNFVIQETILSDYQQDPTAGRYSPTVATSKGAKKATDITLWKGHQYPTHHWGLVIDMNSCIGCGACTIACQAENNVPVVGREEVLNRREMHWIRIDRYYSSDAEPGDQKGLEKAAENPEVTFQPMMCQHCNNAPCETVCPVLATTHSNEGLNQMTYNRCIGTRYCANNCPYKVRRFNWFKYHDNKQFEANTAMNNDLGKMVLNPDVTVRSRGVMEKCTMCTQRIQAGKLKAKMAKRKLSDDDVNTACAAACPADAIVFGDMNDPDSKISKMLVEEVDARAYRVLEEIGTKPNVSYLTKIRNKEKNV